MAASPIEVVAEEEGGRRARACILYYLYIIFARVALINALSAVTLNRLSFRRGSLAISVRRGPRTHLLRAARRLNFREG